MKTQLKEKLSAARTNLSDRRAVRKTKHEIVSIVEKELKNSKKVVVTVEAK